jgi:hypothetical protein
VQGSAYFDEWSAAFERETKREERWAVRCRRGLVYVAVVVVAALLVWALPGCNLFDSHVKEFDLMRGMAADAATRLADGAVGQYQVSGQGLNPGIVVEAAIVYRATARYDGLAGQFGVSAQGTFGERSSDPSEVLRIIRDADLTNEERRAILSGLIGRWVSPAATDSLSSHPPLAPGASPTPARPDALPTTRPAGTP